MIRRFFRKNEEKKPAVEDVDVSMEEQEEFLLKAAQMTRLLAEHFEGYVEPLNNVEKNSEADDFSEMFPYIHMTKAVFSLGFFSTGVPVLLYPIYGDTDEHDLALAGLMAAKSIVEGMDVPEDIDTKETPRLYELACQAMHDDNFKHAFEAGKIEGGASAAQIAEMEDSPAYDKLRLTKAVRQTLHLITSS